MDLYESTYKWSCSGCHTEVLAIRRLEQQPLASVICPSCGLHIMVSPTIRRRVRPQLTAAAEVETA